MKKLNLKNWFNPFWIACMSWLIRHGEVVFAILSLSIAVVCNIFCYFSIWNLIAVFLMALWMYHCNQMKIMDNWVNVGCCALVITIFQLISYYVLRNYTEGVLQYFGFVPAILVCCILYSELPLIVYKINQKFVLEKDRHSMSVFGVFILGLIAATTVNWGTFDQIKEAKFAKEPFLQVYDWTVETHRGETYYIISCSKGNIAISPYSYPEIRKINKQTQIRILPNGIKEEGLIQFTKIEIKNQ